MSWITDSISALLPLLLHASKPLFSPSLLGCLFFLSPFSFAGETLRARKVMHAACSRRKGRSKEPFRAFPSSTFLLPFSPSNQCSQPPIKLFFVAFPRHYHGIPPSLPPQSSSDQRTIGPGGDEAGLGSAHEIRRKRTS